MRGRGGREVGWDEVKGMGGVGWQVEGGRWEEGIWRVWSQVEERRHTSEGGLRTRRMEAVWR